MLLLTFNGSLKSPAYCMLSEQRGQNHWVLTRRVTPDVISTLLERNREWAARTAQTNPALFPSLAKGQSPQILWYGCSDSRVPETTVLDLQPGEVFVHRNIANVLPATDLSSLSVLQYAVEVLQVQHIIVCGHYSCGGVNAALGQKKLGLIDSWLRHVREVRAKYEKELEGLTQKQQSDRLVEFNVIEQVRSVLKNANVQEAMEERGLEVHGWVFDVACGKCHVLEFPEDSERHVFTIKDHRKELQ
ncbi:carbonic anhydrase [Sphaerosporella brunnea]|uniref:Carbonic anhydrase n=1 Tax=Sphaerosporella brunnea TaxID=1250544 RepID=A0A5J5F3W3_9PEZI|nr:carbonic anhydrase [Sphaerosporella brunnea]